MQETLETRAIALWKRWGTHWMLYTSCAGCKEVRHCRGRRRNRMLCLECFDLEGR